MYTLSSDSCLKLSFVFVKSVVSVQHLSCAVGLLQENCVQLWLPCVWLWFSMGIDSVEKGQILVMLLTELEGVAGSLCTSYEELHF